MSTKFQVVDGWVRGARCCESPNFNQRPLQGDISLLVIHNISLPPGQFAGDDVERFFCNQLDFDSHPFYQEIRGVEVSAHLFIRRDGELVQFVSLDNRAWHAGMSEFEGRDQCNDFSIGIELEGTDSQSYTDQQYQVLSVLTQAIQHAYPEISAERITGHSDIAPGRKTDPGEAFDWLRYRSSLK
ncbi:1,6-anhydro-N-acetylmuramyl-L-alanine amidase AmpD [Marinobacterium jannaschii]|uniref:1,6-anhydro-N-acetylmuramyl-L-alanine amidase AmpD n=1 Tax=Marinobacterium jannaschii TaxID=64970 RepID=UPI0004822011|nr:1,6-anhydro-N-acetylmuramyl-L-alanine amidase AmpD [Marinobacterium jannaschii]